MECRRVAVFLLALDNYPDVVDSARCWRRVGVALSRSRSVQVGYRRDKDRVEGQTGSRATSASRDRAHCAAHEIWQLLAREAHRR